MFHMRTPSTLRCCPDVMIELQSVTFGYSHASPLFEDFSLSISRGETWALLGPSGCGKTTLLYLLAGLRQPTSGQICIEGELLTRPRPRSGLILQDYGLLPWSTVRENVDLGQRQRTAIARTLALEPDLLLMDEPFSSLDAITRGDLQELTLSLCAEQNLTLVIVTHAIEE